MRFRESFVWVVAFTLLAGAPVFGQEPEFQPPAFKAPAAKLPAVFDKAAPENVEDLKAIQDHVATVVENVSPAVVSVRVGSSSGSGVIVSKDGYILTAGHVSGAPGRAVTIYFHNGKIAKGKTLGGNHGIDSGMIKITTLGEWPFVDLGDSAAMKNGHWCMVIAHPGGFKPGRTPPVRLGRLLRANATTLTTDCILVGGDSGGPLFDMHGRVVGINSRIGNPLTANMHVPVNPFRDNWAKIAKSEVWGGKLGGGGLGKSGPYLGVQTDPNGEGCVILRVTPGSPADLAGLKARDVVLKLNANAIASAAMLPKLVLSRKVGDVITLEVRRGEETLMLKVKIGKRS
ncbi:MAG: serine protease [Planctomycetes bacterium]|nr:serine protease [Planctomycetota bacterium]